MAKDFGINWAGMGYEINSKKKILKFISSNMDDIEKDEIVQITIGRLK